MSKYNEVLLPFLKMMETELHANAGKGDRPGWLAMDRNTALLEIFYHLGKLQKALKDSNLAGIREHAADVANMSMMLVDICGLLPTATPPVAQGVPEGWKLMPIEPNEDVLCVIHNYGYVGDDAELRDLYRVILEVAPTPPSSERQQPAVLPEGKLLVSAEPLRKVLSALVSAPHHVRELQATREPAALFADNPINVLIAELNTAQGGDA